MIHPLYVMKMSLHIISPVPLPVAKPSQWQGHSHDHKRIKVLQPIQHRFDDMGAACHLALVMAWSEEERGSLSRVIMVIVAIEDAASSS